MELVRDGRRKVRGPGFVVTLDVNSGDRSVANAVYAFIHGRTLRTNGKEYRYPGFIDKEGVRYLGQSVFFVLPQRLRELTAFLSSKGVDYDVDSNIFP